jgi:hypothetical protein
MLSILGLVAIIVLTIQVYKSAASTGRNAAGWAALTFVVGFGIQFVIPVMIGLIYGVYLASTGSTDVDVDVGYVGLISIIGIGGIVLSIVGMWLIAKHVSKVIDDGVNPPAPPPPPTFGQ